MVQNAYLEFLREQTNPTLSTMRWSIERQMKMVRDEGEYAELDLQYRMIDGVLAARQHGGAH